MQGKRNFRQTRTKRSLNAPKRLKTKANNLSDQSDPGTSQSNRHTATFTKIVSAPQTEANGLSSASYLEATTELIGQHHFVELNCGTASSRTPLQLHPRTPAARGPQTPPPHQHTSRTHSHRKSTQTSTAPCTGPRLTRLESELCLRGWD